MIALAALVALLASHPRPEGVICKATHDHIDILLPVDADPRIGSMAVVRGGKWVFLADGENRYAPFRSGVRRLSLHPSQQFGALDGQRVRAFPAPGVYRIVFADNLETEPANMISLDCLVRVR